MAVIHWVPLTSLMRDSLKAVLVVAGSQVSLMTQLSSWVLTSQADTLLMSVVVRPKFSTSLTQALVVSSCVFR